MNDRKRTPLYVPDWEPIAIAVGRIVADGADEKDAKAAICSAVADKKVEVQVTVGGGKHSYRGGNVGAPKHLRPDMIDWQSSRPVARWWIGPMPGQYFWLDGDHKEIELLEVSVADVRHLFCAPQYDEAKPRITDDELRVRLKGELTTNPKLTQNEAEEIARGLGVIGARKKIRGWWVDLGGSTKPGPRRSRKNRAARPA